MSMRIQAPGEPFPRELSSYAALDGAPLTAVLSERLRAEPFDGAATALFVLAVLHCFMTAWFRRKAHAAEERHRLSFKDRGRATDMNEDGLPDEVSFSGQVLHFLGEVEAVFGIWAVPLAAAIAWYKGLGTAVWYLGEKVEFTEPLFVVVIMTLASTRPVMRFAEGLMRRAAGLGGGTPAAWWLAILTVAPLLGSFITEPGAMTIGALLLSRQFYSLNPSERLKYATLGLLFVNVSIGGTLTHFAAPPILMVAGPWGWDTRFMLTHFGYEAVTGILVSNLLYFLWFRKELSALRPAPAPGAEDAAPAPVWVTAVHLFFLGLTVWAAHYPPIFIGAFLFFLAFAQATAHHQAKVELKGPLLVGFFLAGLVIHGGLQAWWIAPVLGRLGELALFTGAAFLTSFNDNALITYLATLVPNFTPELKHAVVAGAVTGGGLTVIANAPNPAGQSILSRHFPEGVSPLGLFLGALVPTLVVAAAFLAF